MTTVTDELKYDIAAIMTAHGEGALSAVSLSSFMDAADHAEANNFTVQRLIVLDRADQKTRLVFEELDLANVEIKTTDFGDQGKVRNFASEFCSAHAVAFLDGDDLWGENWLTEAYLFLTEYGDKAIAHPEFSVFFEGVSSVFVNIDQDDPEFDARFLRFANYWDAMCMAWRSTHLAHPYCDRRIKDGFAFEDWHWNCETVADGFVHKVVKDTVHFKRRRQSSQTIEASGNRSLMPATALASYQWSPA